jgi:hypothetical protein
MTMLLQASAAALPDLGFQPQDVNACSLHAGGAMALLCGGIDHDILCILGSCWKSDTMFHYLHAQATPLIQNLASTKLTHGVYTLAVGHDLPICAAHQTIQQAPTALQPAPPPQSVKLAA